jgi:hypothetical protein
MATNAMTAMLRAGVAGWRHESTDGSASSLAGEVGSCGPPSRWLRRPLSGSASIGFSSQPRPPLDPNSSRSSTGWSPAAGASRKLGDRFPGGCSCGRAGTRRTLVSAGQVRHPGRHVIDYALCSLTLSDRVASVDARVGRSVSVRRCRDGSLLADGSRGFAAESAWSRGLGFATEARPRGEDQQPAQAGLTCCSTSSFVGSALSALGAA